MKTIISENIRIRYPEHFSIGDYSIVDAFCYFSTKVKIGNFCHLASGCSIAGGKECQFVLGDYSGISSGVRIYCTSADFVEDLTVIVPPEIGEFGDKPIAGDVTIGAMTAIGANSVVMPNNNIPIGTVIGALSFVPTKFKFESWSVYAGIPIKLIKKRNKKNVLEHIKTIESNLKGYCKIYPHPYITGHPHPERR